MSGAASATVIPDHDLRNSRALHIDKLLADGSNFNKWDMQVRMHLKSQSLWDKTTDGPTAIPAANEPQQKHDL
jgi:hypothetical protein